MKILLFLLLATPILSNAQVRYAQSLYDNDSPSKSTGPYDIRHGESKSTSEITIKVEYKEPTINEIIQYQVKRSLGLRNPVYEVIPRLPNPSISPLNPPHSFTSESKKQLDHLDKQVYENFKKDFYRGNNN